MDPITHALTGAILGRAGLNRLAPRMAPLAVGASIWPDIDVVAYLAGGLAYLEVHRGWTHALVMLPLQAALLTLPWRWWAARAAPVSARSWIKAFFAAWFCLALHVFLDTWNVYGVRPFVPFSWEWVHFDWLHVFDLWIWAILLLGFLSPMLAGLVYSEIGARRGSGAGAAWFALVLLAGYVGGRAILHDHALAQISARLYESETPRQAFAIPGPANPLQWKGVVETGSAWHVVDAPLLGEFDPEAGQTFYKPESANLMEAVSTTRVGRVFLDFSHATAWRITPAGNSDGTMEIVATDLRFGLPAEGRFTSRWVLNPAGRLLSESFQFESKLHSQ
jgi:inner membrane protein